MPTITNFYSWKEASQHASREECWVVIDGKVYNVTDYLDEHPGGDDVLLEAAGKDATDEFEDAGHSKSARELMKDYCIGEIDPSSDPPPVIPELEIISKEKPMNIVVQLLTDKRTMQCWVFPAAIVGISMAVGLLYLRMISGRRLRRNLRRLCWAYFSPSS